MLEPLPTVRPPRRAESPLARNLPVGTAFDCLKAGWRDLRTDPGPSLIYGVLLFLITIAVIWALYAMGLFYLALPAMAGFLIVGPFLAIGLYHKSRTLAEGGHLSLAAMWMFRPVSVAQLFFAGLMLCLFLIFWLRAADLLYALFFGLQPFPGYEEALINTFTTWRGWFLLISGSFVGALFAGFAFAISVYAIPMLATERGDALTAMGLSFAMVMRNLGPSLAWGVIVTVGLGLSALTGFLGLIVVFPVLGHGTWHLFRAVRGPEAGQ